MQMSNTTNQFQIDKSQMLNNLKFNYLEFVLLICLLGYLLICNIFFH